MGILKIFALLKRRLSPLPLDQWYSVISDDKCVFLNVAPPGTTNRPESYVIPAEASGGKEFVEKMLELKMFDEEYFIEAMGATNGDYYCWPKHDQDE